MFAPDPASRDAGPARAPAVPGPLGGALGLPGGAAAALVAWMLGGDPTTGLVTAALAAAWLGAMTTPLGAVVAAAQCWAFFDGFLLHRFGTLDGGRADLVALGIVAGCAVAAHLVARARASADTTGYPAVQIPRIVARAGTVAE